MKLFHPPNRVPQERTFIYVVEGHLCPAAALIRVTAPNVFVASLDKAPPQFQPHGFQTVQSWQSYHKAAARARGVTVFWAGSQGAVPNETWRQELRDALAEFFNSNRHIRMLVGGEDPQLKQNLELKSFPEFLIFSSLPALCETATDMINHHYHMPDLAVTR